MSITGNIRKALFVTLWSVIGAGVLVLLVAAINSRNSKSCKNYNIKISGAQRLFIDKQEVLNVLTDHGRSGVTGRSVASFNLEQIKDSVMKNKWVRTAQVFFDNNEILRVNIIQREPVARIFTTAGASFYIDSSGSVLPIGARLPIKLPVFTGYPTDKIGFRAGDSILLPAVRHLGTYIMNDSFWMAQISQVDITPSGTFEMVPLIGNHIIEFGNADDYQKKFKKLFAFYNNVLNKTGFDRYSRINIAYTGQIVATRKYSGVTKSDSLLAIKNIQQLIKTARQMQADTAKDQNFQPLPPAPFYKESAREQQAGDSAGKPNRISDALKPVATHDKLHQQH